MKSTTLFICILAIFSIQFSDWTETITVNRYCTINAVQLDSNKNIRLYSPSHEVVKIFDDIFKLLPVTRERYLIRRSPDVKKAIAVRHQNKMYIIYNHNFIRRMKRLESEKAAIYFVLIHELAHHINGHTFEGGSRDSTELQADSSAARVMRELGFDEDETLTVLKYLNEEATNTHPSRMDRKYAIISGWENGMRPLKSHDIIISVRQKDVKFIIINKATDKIEYRGSQGYSSFSLVEGQYEIQYYNATDTLYKSLNVPVETLANLLIK